MLIDAQSTPENRSSRPWYSEPMAWFVFALPASVVVAGIATAIIAWRGADGPVAADTYRLGLAINESLARTALARELGIEAEVVGGLGDASGHGDPVLVRVRARSPMPDERELELRWVHPGRTHGDRHAQLVRMYLAPDARSAEYVGRVLASGPAATHTAWRVVVAGRAWRLDGDIESAKGGSVPRAGGESGAGTTVPASIVLRAPE